MFESPFGEHLVFKGGTSLSKAYGAIKRFSEDVDLTYDIRSLALDPVSRALLATIWAWSDKGDLSQLRRALLALLTALETG